MKYKYSYLTKQNKWCYTVVKRA